MPPQIALAAGRTNRWRQRLGERRAPCYDRSQPSIEGTGFVVPISSARGVGTIVEVQVRDNNVDQALRALKKKMQREGLYREMRMRRHYEKPSERRAREKAEAVRRYRKLLRKRAERDEL